MPAPVTGPFRDQFTGTVTGQAGWVLTGRRSRFIFCPVLSSKRGIASRELQPSQGYA